MTIKIICFLNILLLLFLQLSCTKDDPNPITPVSPPLTETEWALKSISFSYSGNIVDPGGWKQFIINSGLAAFLGTMKLKLTVDSFNLTAQLDPAYSDFFPSGLNGSCLGSLRIQNNLLIFHTQNATGVFVPGRSGQEAYGTYRFEGTDLILDIVMPAYIKTQEYPFYIRVGEEYYWCRFGAN